MKNPVSFVALFVGIVAVGAIIFGGVIKPIKEAQTAAVINSGVTVGTISMVGRITPSNYCRALTSAYTTKGVSATNTATDISTICGAVTPTTNASSYTINRYFTAPTYSKKSNTSFNYMVVIKNTSGATIRNFSISNLVPAGYTVNAAKSNYTTGMYNNGTFTLPKLGIVRNVIIYMNVTFPTATCDRINAVAPGNAALKQYGVCATRGTTGTTGPSALIGCSVSWSSAGGGTCTTGGCSDGPGSSYSMSASQYTSAQNACGGDGNTADQVNNCIAETCASGITTGGGGSSGPIDNSEKDTSTTSTTSGSTGGTPTGGKTTR